MTKETVSEWHPTDNDTHIVIYPDHRGPVIIRNPRPRPVPLPALRGWEDDLYEEEVDEPEMAAV